MTNNIRLFVLATMRDEVDGLFQFLCVCAESGVPSEQIVICADNLDDNKKDEIIKLLEEANVNYVLTNNRSPRIINNYYLSVNAATEFAKECGAGEKENDLFWISPIDVIPNPGFYKEIISTSKNIIKQHGIKWQGSAGYYFHQMNDSNYVYPDKDKKYRRITVSKVGFLNWKERVKGDLKPGAFIDVKNNETFCPIIQPVKRWNELGGVLGNGFSGTAAVSYDLEYAKKGLKDGGTGLLFRGCAIYHYDFRKELQPKRKIREIEGMPRKKKSVKLDESSSEEKPITKKEEVNEELTKPSEPQESLSPNVSVLDGRKETIKRDLEALEEAKKELEEAKKLREKIEAKHFGKSEEKEEEYSGLKRKKIFPKFIDEPYLKVVHEKFFDEGSKELFDFVKKNIIAKRNLYGNIGECSWGHGGYGNLGTYFLSIMARDYKNVVFCGQSGDLISGYKLFILKSLADHLKINIQYIDEGKLKDQEGSLIFFDETVIPSVESLEAYLQNGNMVHLCDIRDFSDSESLVIGPWRTKVNKGDRMIGVQKWNILLTLLSNLSVADKVRCVSLSTLAHKLDLKALAICEETNGIELNPYVYLFLDK